jgi:predicted secreted hydrolase
MRRVLTIALLLAYALLASGAAFDPVTPGATLHFPRDSGAHPGHRIEWWYVTGQLESPHGPVGFQVTFFRVANPEARSNPSRFSPKQLLFAHAALADPQHGRLLQDQRSARELEGLVVASTADTDVRLDDWSLVREGNGYRARVQGAEFALDLALASTQPVLLEGDKGFSRKGPAAPQASYYYSEPQLAASGRIRWAGGREATVRGLAWLDHEWSSEMLSGEAVGWDWLGANLDDGGALMAFRIRGGDGAVLWSAAAWRKAGGETERWEKTGIRFRPRRTWKSPRTGTDYPIAMDVEIEAQLWRLDPIMDDQELDARSSTGTLYWEGAVRIEGPDGMKGRGYLELTGYAERLRL